MKILKESNNFNENMLKEFIKKIWNIMEEESCPEVLINQGTVLRNILNDNSNFLNQTELENFYNNCIKFLNESDKRK